MRRFSLAVLAALNGRRNKMVGLFVELVEMTFSSHNRKGRRRCQLSPDPIPDLACLRCASWRDTCASIRARSIACSGEQKLPAFRVGSDWRFNREEIERWMIEEQKRS